MSRMRNNRIESGCHFLRCVISSPQNNILNIHLLCPKQEVVQDSKHERLPAYRVTFSQIASHSDPTLTVALERAQYKSASHI